MEELTHDARCQPELVQSDIGQQLHPSWAWCRSPRLPYHHFCLRGLGGSWHGRARRLKTFWLCWWLEQCSPPGRDHQVARCLRVLRHVWTAGRAVEAAAARAAFRRPWRFFRCRSWWFFRFSSSTECAPLRATTTTRTTTTTTTTRFKQVACPFCVAFQV